MIQTYQNIVKLLKKKDKNIPKSSNQENISQISANFSQFHQGFQERMGEIKALNFKQPTIQMTQDTLENTNPTPTIDRSIKSKRLKEDTTITDNFIYSPSTGECNSFYDNLIESQGYRDRIRDETTILRDSTYYLTRSLKMQNFNK